MSGDEANVPDGLPAVLPAALPAARGPAEADPGGAWALLDALLYSVSHDFRSPLLTMTLSAELIEEGLARAQETENVTIGLASLRQGGGDLERMIAALTSLSRARRERVTPTRVPLRLLLGGYETAGVEGSTDGLYARTDAIAVRDCIDAIAEAADAEVIVAVSIGQEDCRLRVPLPVLIHGEVSPLAALVRSLQQFAGTFVEVLAAHQLRLERCGARVAISDGALLIELPVESSL